MREAVSKEPANCRLVPSTVTFLFTDIEGSTALWERDRFAIATVVERHLAWLHTSIAISGGVLFKTVGDAVQAAFATAPDAVVAALARQRALPAENWGALGELPVRLTLHAGEAAPDEQGDYLAFPTESPRPGPLAPIMAARLRSPKDLSTP